MRVTVRADASIEIGTGHVVRCLTLAQELRARQADVCFVTSSQSGNLDTEIIRQGFSVQRSPPAQSDWLVVDHYDLAAPYETAQRARARRIMVIDDLADRVHDCDLLLDQNLYDGAELRYSKLVPAHAAVLTGPRFALLRAEFLAAREQAQPRTSLRNLLVFFGGSDPTDETSKSLRALVIAGLQGVRVTVIVGASNPHRAAIESLAKTIEHCVVQGPTTRIANLFLQADLAIGAGGTTTWERCCLGLPTIVIAVAANQREVSRMLMSRGYQRFLGEHFEVSERRLADAIRAASDEFSGLAAAAARGMQLVDGAGVNRVCAAMLGSSPPANVRLRRATALDAQLLLEWRNDEMTRAASRSSELITAEQHATWMERSLANPRRRLLVAELDGEPVGTVRADEAAGEVTLSWTVAPAARGRGIAKYMVAALASEITGPIRAEVKSLNTASARVAEYAGMHLREEINGMRIYVRQSASEKH